MNYFIDQDILFIETRKGVMRISGEVARDQLSNGLGFEADRARRLPLAAITDEISIFWQETSLPPIADEGYIVLANASLITGAVGRQKLMDLLYKFIEKPHTKAPINSVAGKILVIAGKYQSILNLSRNRGVYINAHLNLLEPDRTLHRIYAPYISEIDLKKYRQKSNSLLEASISSESSLRAWINDVHVLLDGICELASTLSRNEDSGVSQGVKGIISKKSMSTYFKQWEMFVLEILGPEFGIPLREISPISEKLNELETGKNRSWTSIIREITEAEKSGELQKKISTTIQSKATAQLKNEDLSEFRLYLGTEKRPMTFAISTSDINEVLIEQFMLGIRAQLAIYNGKDLFEFSTNYQGGAIHISLPNATKNDLPLIEKSLLTFIK